MRAIVMLAMGCLASAVVAERAPTPAPALATFDLGRHHRPVSTRNAGAQRAFDQGLVWARALEALDQQAEAASVRQRLRLAWARAELPAETACLCVRPRD